MPARDETPPRQPVDDIVSRQRPSISAGPPLCFDRDWPRTLVEALARAANGTRGIRYVDGTGRQVAQTYAELYATAGMLAGGLAAQVPGESKPVLLQLEHPRDFIEAFWACILAGHIPAPLSFAIPQTPRGLQRLDAAWELLERPPILCRQAVVPELIESCRGMPLANARTISFEELVESSPGATTRRRVSESDVAMVLFTSGSTAGIKAVPLAHRNLIAMAAGTAMQQSFDEREVTLNWLPLDHVGAISFLHVMPTWLGCSQLHVATSYVLAHVPHWLELASSHQATISWAPNFAFRLLAQHTDEMRASQWDLSRLRFLVSAGEQVMPQTLREAWQLLSTHQLPSRALRPAFGMSETCSGITWADRLEMPCDNDPRLSELGPPIPGTALRVVDDAGEVVPEGSAGHLQLRGDSVMSGYLADLDATRAAFTTDGWFRTGDLGRLTDGRLTIVGREKDVLIVRGVHYAAEEIETVVEDLSGVRPTFTAACGVRDADSELEQLLIFLVPTDRTNREDLVDQVRRQLASRFGLTPLAVICLNADEIPKTGIGKIQRAELRRRWSSGEFAAQHIPAIDPEPVLYQLEWSPHSIDRNTPGTSPELDGPWIVLCDRGYLAEGLVEHLPARAGRPWLVGPPDDLVDSEFPLDQAEVERMVKAILQSQPGEKINLLHAWCLSNGASTQRDVDSIRKRLRLNLAALLHVVQSIKNIHPGAAIRLVMVTRGARALPNDTADIDLVGATLLGYVRGIAVEDQRIQTLCIDLDPDTREDDVELVLDEILHTTGACEVAYRKFRRYIPRLATAQVKKTTRFEIRPDATYLITGGTGGLGRVVAEWLIDRGARQLLLVSRHEPDAEVVSRLAIRSRQRASIDYLAADVSTAGGIERIQRSLKGLPALGCVFHLAGLADDQPFTQHTLEHVEQVLAGKALGALHLQEQLLGGGSIGLVMFSSMLSLFGAPRQASYVAACAFLDALSADRRRHNLPAMSIAWGPWNVPGMATRTSPLNFAVLRSAGLQPFSRAQGLSILSRCVDQESGEFLAASIDWKRYVAAHARSEMLTMLELLAGESTESETDDDLPDSAELRRMPEQERLRVYTNYMERHLGRLLGRRMAKTDLSRPFPELGLDSVTSAAFLRCVMQLLGRSLPLDLLLRHPRTDELAAHLAWQFGQPNDGEGPAMP